MKVKLGQQIQFKTDQTIELAKGGTAQVKAGDIAKVLKKIDDLTAEIIYITGEAKGLSHNVPLEVDDDFDIDLIAKRIMKELND